MRSFRRNACIAVTLLSLTGMAGAADIRVLSVGAVQNAVRALAADFGTESGHHVVLTFGAPVVVTQKIKDGEVFDAVIVSEPAMDRLDQDGVVNPESRVPLAKTGMGVAVRRDQHFRLPAITHTLRGVRRALIETFNRLVILAVAISIIPASGRTTPPSKLMSVDFPAPFSPRRAWISPR